MGILELIFFIEFYFLCDLDLDLNFSDKSEGRDIKFQRRNVLVSFHYFSILVIILVLNPEIDCQKADWSRANHLGVTKAGEFNQYKWELPYFNDDQPRDCVFRIVPNFYWLLKSRIFSETKIRIRYNISSDDYPEQFDHQDSIPYYSTQDSSSKSFHR